MSRLPIDLACQHLKSTGHSNPSQASSFIAKLLKNNGQKFALDYLSKVADAVRETMITGRYVIPIGVKTRRYLLKDHTRVVVPAEGWIRSTLNTAKYIYDNHIPLSHKMVRKVHAVINLKHVFMYDSVQSHHIEKFNDALMRITFKKWESDDNLDITRSKRVKKEVLKASLFKPQVDSLYSYFVTDKKSPVFNYEGLQSDGFVHPLYSVKSKDPRSRDFTPIALLHERCSHDAKILIEELLPELLHYKCNRTFSVLLGRAHRAVSKKNYSSSVPRTDADPTLLSGKISHIMESGGKDRAVAQPFLSLQVLFEPLKKILSKMQEADDNIHTFDQIKGVEIAQSALKRGKTLYCYDASSFTDKFPLEYQLHVLNKYDLGDWSDLVRAFSKGTFYDPEQKRSVHYAQGQPQGLGPSFGLATLSHSDMVNVIYSSLYEGIDYIEAILDRPYGVVGDDIFICDERVAKVYDNIMNNWGVQINRTKSVISDRYGEFCGVLFDRNSKIPAYKPKEWRLSHDSLFSSYSYYGKNWLKTFDLVYKKLGPKRVSESYDDQYVFRHTLASKGGGLKKLGVQSLLNLIKQDVNNISSWILSSADYSAPHYGFLESFVREAVNLNYKRGYHTHRFRSAGNSIFTIESPDSSGHRTKSNGSLTSRLELLLTENYLQDLFEDADILIEFSQNLSNQDDFEAFEELFHSYTLRVNEIYTYEKNSHESDPRKKVEVSLKDLLDRSKSVRDLISTDPKDVMATLQPISPIIEEIDGSVANVVIPKVQATLRPRFPRR